MYAVLLSAILPLLYRHLTSTLLFNPYLHQISSLITMCQSIISALKFMLRSADAEERIDLEKVWNETRDYMRYLSRRVAQDDSRKSLCELRENGLALNFMDLTKVSR